VHITLLHFRYPDLVQPLQLAVQELLRGVAMQTASARAAVSRLPPQALRLMSGVIAGLLAFPSPASLPGSESALSVVGTSSLGTDLVQELLQQVVAEAARAAASATPGADMSRLITAAEVAGYSARLQACRAALHLLAREILSAGPWASSGIGGRAVASSCPSASLSALEQLLAAFVDQVSL
jgi:hypothetical protein